MAIIPDATLEAYHKRIAKARAKPPKNVIALPEPAVDDGPKITDGLADRYHRPESPLGEFLGAWGQMDRQQLDQGRYSSYQPACVLDGGTALAIFCGPLVGDVLKTLGGRYRRVKGAPPEFAKCKAWVVKGAAAVERAKRELVDREGYISLTWGEPDAKPKPKRKGKKAASPDTHKPGVRAQWAFGQECSPSAKLVLLAMCHGWNAGAGLCTYSMSTLARMSGLSRRSVVRAVGELSDARLVRVCRSDYGPGKKRLANHYVLAF